MIAGGYDEVHSDGGTVLSHAGAYRRSGCFEIVGCVEPDATRRKEFMEYWKVDRGFSSIDEALSDGIAFEVASVCSPTADHPTSLRKLLTTSVRAVFCEKPICESLQEAVELADAYRKQNRILVVNYRRQWDPSMIRLAQDLKSGRWGKVLAGSVFYGKGLRHSASHIVDLLTLLLGPLEVCGRLGRRGDFVQSDPSHEAVLRTADGASVVLLVGDDRAVSVFEVHLVTEKGLIDIEDSGHVLRVRPSRRDPRYPSHVTPSKGERIKTGLEDSIFFAVENLREALGTGATIRSGAESAIATMSICEQIALSPSYYES